MLAIHQNLKGTFMVTTTSKVFSPLPADHVDYRAYEVLRLTDDEAQSLILAAGERAEPYSSGASE